VIYRTFVRPILFRLDPERSHDLALTLLGSAGPPLSYVRRPGSGDSRFSVVVCGIPFPTPIGLAGGFDKAGRALWAWPALGFGFVEVGTVTALPQPGNPRPRVFRLPEDEALINRLGFNSPGARAVAARLAAVRRSRPYPIPLGANIGKSAAVPAEEALADYVFSLERLHPYADFLVVNVSSPNTPGLRGLQMRSALTPLLDGLSRRNQALGAKPLFVKIAPDLREAELEEIAGALEGRAQGIVATNTTMRRNGLRSAARSEAGGLSGRPLSASATHVIRAIFRLTGGRVPIIGVGGVFTAEDAYAKIKAGASLVELYTGFVYGGPGTPRRILTDLGALLARDGFKTLSQAVGVEAS
jgi:dihydroorotate dehydrogenase